MQWCSIRGRPSGSWSSTTPAGKIRPSGHRWLRRDRESWSMGQGNASHGLGTGLPPRKNCIATPRLRAPAMQLLSPAMCRRRRTSNGGTARARSQRSSRRASARQTLERQGGQASGSSWVTCSRVGQPPQPPRTEFWQAALRWARHVSPAACTGKCLNGKVDRLHDGGANALSGAPASRTGAKRRRRSAAGAGEADGTDGCEGAGLLPGLTADVTDDARAQLRSRAGSTNRPHRHG